MADESAGLAALAALDGVLAGQPDKNGHGFSATTRCLSAYRDELIGDLRAGRSTPELRARLGRVNAVISIVLAGHFPLGKIPWAEIETARSTLANALRG